MLRRLVLAWRISRFLPYNDTWENCWVKDDAQHLKSFSNTVTGKRLLGILQNLVVTSAKDAAYSDNPVRACGMAAGVAYTVTTIEELFPQEEVTQQEIESVEEILERTQ